MTRSCGQQHQRRVNSPIRAVPSLASRRGRSAASLPRLRAGRKGAAAPVFGVVGGVDRISRAGSRDQEDIACDGSCPDASPAGFLCGPEPAGFRSPVGADVELATDDDHAELHLHRAGLVSGGEAERAGADEHGQLVRSPARHQSGSFCCAGFGRSVSAEAREARMRSASWEGMPGTGLMPSIVHAQKARWEGRFLPRERSFPGRNPTSFAHAEIPVRVETRPAPRRARCPSVRAPLTPRNGDCRDQN